MITYLICMAALLALLLRLEHYAIAPSIIGVAGLIVSIKAYLDASDALAKHAQFYAPDAWRVKLPELKAALKALSWQKRLRHNIALAYAMAGFAVTRAVMTVTTDNRLARYYALLKWLFRLSILIPTPAVHYAIERYRQTVFCEDGSGPAEDRRAADEHMDEMFAAIAWVQWCLGDDVGQVTREEIDL